MSIKSTSTDRTTSDINDETSSSGERKRKPSKKSTKKESIKTYVTDVLVKRDNEDEQPADATPPQIEIATNPDVFRDYINPSAFRRYKSTEQGQDPNLTSEDELLAGATTEEDAAEFEDSVSELNLDPNPIREVRESTEQTYKQKVYLRQLQPPTPQPVEIQVQEVLIKPLMQKPPIHVRVGQNEPRTPSPILIKTALPAPPIETSQPLIYNKYLPPPKQAPQQIIIHRYPDLPPKPRPIIVEQWLPYKPAPKRIIKHTLPREAAKSPTQLHNIIVSYSKPRALIEVELVRLPIVRIDPHAYEEISSGGEEQLRQHPTFQHEQNFITPNRSAHTSPETSQLNWRI